MFTKKELEYLKSALTIDILSDEDENEQKLNLLDKIEKLIDNYSDIN